MNNPSANSHSISPNPGPAARLLTRLLLAAMERLPGNRPFGRLLSGGERRSYLLHVPPGYDPGRAAPLVISMHGYAEWPAHQMQISRWNELADRAGFIVAYPCGTHFPLRWRMHGLAGTHLDPLRDLEFISALIDRLESEYNLDPARIFVNGLSNGGGMSFVLACTLSERIAAFGSVSGAYLRRWEQCTPARAVPAIIFHGTADPIVPYHGGPSRAFNLPFPDVPLWVEELARRSGCGTLETLPPQGQVSGLRYTGSSPQAEVLFYTIAGGGHSWPGGQPLPRWIAGSTSSEIDATVCMWEFFQAHPMHGTP